MGLVTGGGWAEQVAVPTAMLAPLPDELDVTAAATLPVAGLTAVRALAVPGVLDGKRVLVTGAAGGVGHFAVQLADHGGAHVTAVVGRPERADHVRRLGVDEVIVGDLPSGDEYDVILESVGGASLGAALASVAPGGVVVSYGNSSGACRRRSTPAASSGAAARGSTPSWCSPRLARHGSGTRDLTDLARAAASGRLDTGVTMVVDWADAATAMDALMDRRVAGKAVLTIG